MKFLNLLLILAPTLFNAHSALAAPTRGPLITVPGNFSAVSHQEAEYAGIVQRLRKAQATGNTTDVNNSTNSSKPSNPGTAVNLGDVGSASNATGSGNSTASASTSNNGTATALPDGGSSNATSSDYGRKDDPTHQLPTDTTGTAFASDSNGNGTITSSQMSNGAVGNATAPLTGANNSTHAPGRNDSSSSNSTMSKGKGKSKGDTSTPLPVLDQDDHAGESSASSNTTSSSKPSPSGGRGASTAAPYGKNSTSTSVTSGNSTSTPLDDGSTASNSTSTSTKGVHRIDGNYNGTTVISWLANGPNTKGGDSTCSVSIKSHGANGTEIITDEVSSANVSTKYQGLANSGASGGESIPQRGCSTASSVNRDREASVRTLVSKKQKQLRSQRKAMNNADLGHVLASQNITVPVVFHIITDGDKGALSDSDVSKQMAVLNKDYKDYGFAFKLDNTTRTDNSLWFTGATYGGDTVEDMKTSLRQGDAQTLNIYTVDFLDGTLGFSTFPWDFKNSPKEDGIVIDYSTLPGGAARGYNEGRTATHETGHFLGLYHTFMGSCGANGDYVSDTPRSASPTSGCPARRDSCPGDNLDDPIHNYMDYSTDECLNQFTEGQAVRMQTMWDEYRRGK